MIAVLTPLADAVCKNCGTKITQYQSDMQTAEWLHADTLREYCPGAPLASPADVPTEGGGLVSALTDAEALAEVIRAKYDQHPADRYPTEGALADWIIASDWLAGREKAARAAALREVADEWQYGGWTILSAPVDPAAIPAIARAQRVTDWLRERADAARGDA